MQRVSLERWTAWLAAFRLAPHPEMFDQVCASYSESHRQYHTLDHIDACLLEFDAARCLARSQAEVEGALWFHDVVYEPRATDNERRSADMAARFLASAGASVEACAHVHAHIMATAHAAEPKDADACFVVDIDLSILGQNTDTYDRFEHAVREEYRWVPLLVYRRKRAQILQSFLDRESVYATEWFRSRYEQSARANLRRAIEALRK